MATRNARTNGKSAGDNGKRPAHSAGPDIPRRGSNLLADPTPGPGLGGPTPWLTLPRDLAGGILGQKSLGKKRKKSKKKNKKNAKKKQKKAKKSDLGGPPLPDEGVPPSFQPPSPPSRMEQPNLQSFPQT